MMGPQLLPEVVALAEEYPQCKVCLWRCSKRGNTELQAAWVHELNRKR